MNKDQTKEAIAVMQAFAAGQEVQLRHRGAPGNEWQKYPASDPKWNWEEFDYRVKPQPRLRPFTAREAVEHLGHTLTNRGEQVEIGWLQQVGVSGVTATIHRETRFIPYDILAAHYGLYGRGPCGVIEEPQ